MKIRSPKALVLAGILVFIGILSPVATKAQLAGEILSRIDAHYKTLQSLKADIKMDKFESGIGDHDISSGNVILLPKTGKRKKMYARIDWLKPREENLVIIGDDYMVYRPKLGVVYVGKTTKKPKNVPAGALDFFSMSRAELKANYNIDVSGDETIEGGVGTKHLVLRPKKAAGYKMADIWVDKDGMIRLAKVTENNNDTSTILLSAIDKNGKVDEKAFRIDYPKTIKPTRI